MTHRGLDKANMGKASRAKVEPSRREKIAAQQAAARRAEQRRRILIASGSILVVLVVVLVFVVVKLNCGKPSGVRHRSFQRPHGLGPGRGGQTVTSVPASTLNTVGAGSGAVTGKPKTIRGRR